MSDYPSLEQAKLVHGQRYPQACSLRLEGPRFVVEYACAGYPDSLMALEDPPERLYGVGNVEALRDGLAVIGARKATPYGRAAARRFAGLAAHHGIPIVSGGALGCDTHAHEGALEAEGQTVAVLGGGCDQLYPKRNAPLFQRIVDGGGAVISERQWDYPPFAVHLPRPQSDHRGIGPRDAHRRGRSSFWDVLDGRRRPVGGPRSVGGARPDHFGDVARLESPDLPGGGAGGRRGDVRGHASGHLRMLEVFRACATTDGGSRCR